jgi:hypothetical protein
MKSNKQFYALALVFIVAFASCKKDEAVTPRGNEIVDTRGIYMLSEGSWGKNNSAIAYYDIATNTVEQDIYKKINKTDLGESANDLKAYGSKMYVVISGTAGSGNSFVEMIDIHTGKSLKRISFNDGTNSFIPRYVAFHQNKAYVSRYDGVISRIDTASMTIDGELQLMNGAVKAGALEGLAVANGKLYVTNSSNDYANPNSLKTKVTVVDLATFKKTRDIEVGLNPVKIAAAGNGDLYTLTWSVWGMDNKPTLVRISSATDAVISTDQQDFGSINITKDFAGVAGNNGIRAINLTTGSLGNSLITDGTKIAMPYGLTVNPFDKSVVVADAVSYSAENGKAYVFGADGKLKYSFATAVLPQHAVFNYNYK